MGGSGDPPPNTNHRQVSLANIATAFLSERKSTSRRQSSHRRKKRLTSNARHQSNSNDDVLGQRISLETIDGGIASMFMTTTNPNNKHRTMVRKKISFSSQID
jgi:hypothetical protein